MALFEQFPYTNFHEMNIDWLLQQVLELDSKVDSFEDDIKAAVEEWFSEHPELQIPDGSITVEKLADELKAAYYKHGSVKFLIPASTNATDTSMRGTCFLAVTPDKTILFDAGSAENWDLINADFTRWYEAGEFSNIDIFVLSHFHSDHISNLSAILAAFPHEGMVAYLPPSAPGAANWSASIAPNQTAVTNALAANGVDQDHRKVVRVDTNVEISEGLVSMLLFNTTDDGASSDYGYYNTHDNNYNNYSMCSLLTIGDSYMMYAGDLQRTGQIRVMATHNLPHLAFYVMHHHGYQGDDFLPYLRAIDPDVCVNSISHRSAYTDGNNEDSSALSLLTGQLGSTAYGSYMIVQDTGGAHMERGITLERGAAKEFDTYLYVDNTYVGEIHDGTEEHPFTQLTEAVAWIPKFGNVTTYISVKPSATTYNFAWFLGITSRIFIRKWPGYEATDVASIKGLVVRGCTNIYITGLTFDGTGRSNYGFDALTMFSYTNAIVYNCTFDGTSIEQHGAAPDTAILLHNATLSLESCTIKNVARGVSGAGASGHGLVNHLASKANNFDSVSDYGIDCFYIDVDYQSHGTLTNTTLSLGTSGTYPHPVTVRGNAVTAESLLTFDSKITSAPFYKSSTYAACIVRNKKCFELSGTERTIS